jgi:VanZ family protein
MDVRGKNAIGALAIIVLMVSYGSLFPFVFRVPATGIGPLQTLLNTWAMVPGRGDFLLNIVLYSPLGFFAVLAAPARLGTTQRIILGVLIGTILSAGLEMLQYYSQGRVTYAGDLYANITGSALGSIGGILLGREFRWPLMQEIQTRPFPMLVLASWLGYRLYPFAPTIDLHKYWDAIKPVVLFPSFTLYDFLRYTVMWLTAAALIESVVRHGRSRLLFPLIAAAILFAKILIVTRVLTLAEIAGAGAGFCLWLALVNQPARRRALLVVLLLFAFVIAWRLEPFQFDDQARRFDWIPFYGLMYGSIEVNTQSFFEKTFYYGSLIWFSVEAGLRIRTSAIIVATLLLLTSAVEIYLPGRSAGVTDAVMSLIIAAIAFLVSSSASTDPQDLPANQLNPTNRIQ